MYFWIAALLPESSEKHIRDVCLPLIRAEDISNTAFLLTQHISLKISFWADDKDAQAIKEYLTFFFQRQTPFKIITDKVESQGEILWLKIKDNPQLERLHEELTEGLENSFKILPHKFDHSFIYHTTIAIDKRKEKIAWLFNQVKDKWQEKEVLISSFVIGTSPDGELNTWKEVRKISVAPSSTDEN